MPVDLRGLVARADQALATIEDEHLEEVTRYLRRAQLDLERGLRGGYTQALSEIKDKSRAFAEARARVLNEEIERHLQAFELHQKGFTEEQIRSMLNDAVDSSTTEALMMLDQFEPGLGNQLATTGTAVNARAVGMVAKNAAERLKRHSAERIVKMKDIVASSLIRGEGVAKATARLRKETGLLRYQAERIIRTETIQAGDEARQAAFAERGIEYVQRIATQDARVCPYCAERAGKVYKIGEAPAALHPNDRCMNIPWKQEWVDLGLIDEDWVKNHRKDAIERMKKSTGGLPKTGKAPFEKANGLPIPKPIWTPSGGLTEFGKTTLAGGGGGSVPPVASPGSMAGAPTTDSLPVEEVHKLMMEDFPTESFSASERELFNQYFLNGIDTNRLLRADNLASNSKLQQLVAQLDEALAGRTIKRDVTLYRGFSIPTERLPSNPAKLVGTILDDAGFQSTSVSREVSEEFLIGGPGKRRIMLKIRAKAGNRGTYLVGANDDIDELEMLLPRQSKFKVVDAVEEQGLWELTVDVVDDAARVADEVVDEAARAVDDAFRPTTDLDGPLDYDRLDETFRAGVQASDDQIEAITEYTSEGYEAINNGLRSGELGFYEQKITEHLDELISTNTLAEDVYLYRGYTVPANSIGNSQAMVGTILDDAAFKSTTLDSDFARSFAKSGATEDSIVMVLKVRGRKGMRAAYLDEFSYNEGEREILLGRQTRFKVVSVVEDETQFGIFTDNSSAVKLLEIEVEMIDDAMPAPPVPGVRPKRRPAAEAGSPLTQEQMQKILSEELGL